jgi:hypothetical protein
MRRSRWPGRRASIPLAAFVVAIGLSGVVRVAAENEDDDAPVVRVGIVTDSSGAGVVDPATGLFVGDVGQLYDALDALANNPGALGLSSSRATIQLAPSAIYRLDSTKGDLGRLRLPFGTGIRGGNSYAESDGVPVAIGVDASGDRIFATDETVIEGSALTGPRAVLEVGLDNAIRNVTVHGGELANAEIVASLRPPSGPANVEVTGCILEKGRRGIQVGGGGIYPGDGTVNLLVERNIIRHHGVPSAVFAWGIQIVPGSSTGARYLAEIRNNLFYDNKIGLFLPSLGEQDGETVVLSSQNVYEQNRFDAGQPFPDKFAAGIFIFVRDFGNPAGSHRNLIQLFSSGDAIWNNSGYGGLEITGVQRDSSGSEIMDNEIDVQLVGTRFVKLADGALDGPQNEDAVAGKRRDVVIVGEVGAGTGTTSGNKVNVQIVGATSSLLPTSYDPDPEPFLVNDNAPAEVALTVSGSLSFDRASGEQAVPFDPEDGEESD